jgi:hypothetical protein
VEETMTQHNNGTDRDVNLVAPERLIEGLKAVYGRPLVPSPVLDHRVSMAAWRHFARARRRQHLMRWFDPLAAAASFGPVAAAAGVVVLMLSLPWGPKVPLAGDYNGDGSVDVLDALALAREESPESMIDSRNDMNKDGILDRRDADRIADMAVVLWKNGPRDES